MENRGDTRIQAFLLPHFCEDLFLLSSQSTALSSALPPKYFHLDWSLLSDSHVLRGWLLQPTASCCSRTRNLHVVCRNPPALRTILQKWERHHTACHIAGQTECAKESCSFVSQCSLVRRLDPIANVRRHGADRLVEREVRSGFMRQLLHEWCASIPRGWPR